MLHIIVCIKQVPDTHKVKVDSENSTLIRGSIENKINPDDLHAIEMALYLKGKYNSIITVITMGPLHAEDVLREAFSLGADKAVLISDSRFAGSDSLITSKILSRAISKLGRYDIVITGVEAIDGNTSNVGYQLSEFLNIPLITQIHAIEIKDDIAVIERLYGHEYQKIKVGLPILLAVDKDANRVRFSRLVDIKTSFEKDFTLITMDDIGGIEDEYGLKGSPTMVLKTESFFHKREHELIDGSLNEKIETFIHKLKKHNILRY